VASHKDLKNLFFSARQEPWIVNGRLVIDPVLDYYFDFAKELYDNRREGRVAPYTGGWFAGIKGELADENGKPVEVFSYFFSARDYRGSLMRNDADTNDDWAMIQGPVGWYEGGSWIAAWKGTKNPESARQMIEWLTTDDEFLEAWALETGEIVNNLLAVNKVKNEFKNTFLGGQNYYAEFAEMAKIVNGRLPQSYDEEIQAAYMEVLGAFVEGKMTKQEAIEDFKAQIMAKFDDISG
jgi:ABC-type glycerol-3-phosphate transport system substrate-binding protein